ncbi:MAG: hypothetical protein J6K46_00550 [Sutterella sp.]|nr:hypothetical protein [Sutterella sp.]
MSVISDVFSSNRHRRAILILINMTSQYEKKRSLHVHEETAQKMSSEMAGMVG